ncbi:proline-rich nuclear receptor coactivator motif domain-containing protein [Hirsutella rhossiliensis]|uniref:Proline-rich nuclear receptor coactivator motif domain-containing protein n=1 Tax=Hirsutella rhossiliensis TaxID=111463 RepID=A0A9P8MRH6_9HYPO|nr:proline-rich nuclear receptor coactivator motif domain-containing protein [Hirsutella rhossiliensis]KAH0960062.1 proline-rich nuclear receptor coactivator motif domain-containing protein [Hirsutella rhossiliensis]
MDDISSQPKLTPARRRPGRGEPRPGARKAYASENDVAALESSRRHRAPQTPSKTSSGSPAPADPGSMKSGPKQRSRNKAKAKNTPASPDSIQRDRQTPPYRSESLRPSTGIAFAGATFHASPAPSALPIPSFHAKPSAGTPVHSSTRDVVQEPSPPATDTDAPTPFRPASVPRTHESPLDFMFRAHREEKERQCRGGGPPSQPDPCVSPSLSGISQSRRTNPRPPSRGIEPSELHSPSGLPMGPAFSTPYQERIRAARSNASRPRFNQAREEQSHAAALPTDDPTEALKKFLFGSNSTPCPATHKAPAAPAPAVQIDAGSYTSQLSAAEPGHPGLSQSNDIQAMEKDLRRILKLDLTSNSS